MDGAVGVDDRAPRRVGLRADRVHQPHGVAHRLGQPAVVALQRQLRGLELERRPQLEQRPASAGVSRATVAPRFGSMITSPSAASARSAARSEWRATP